MLVPEIQFGLLYMSSFITRGIAPHYRHALKEELQLAQAAARFSALQVAYTHAVMSFNSGFTAISQHDCAMASTENSQGEAELSKGLNRWLDGRAKLIQVMHGR